MNDNSTDLRELLLTYREAAAGTRERDPKKHNDCHDKAHACYKILRESEAGRQGIVSLISDPDPYVRCAAAAHSLQWAPAIARRALEALRQDSDPIVREAAAASLARWHAAPPAAD